MLISLLENSVAVNRLWIDLAFKLYDLMLHEETICNVKFVCCCGVVGRITAFQPEGPGSIPGGIRDLISIL